MSDKQTPTKMVVLLFQLHNLLLFVETSGWTENYSAIKDTSDFKKNPSCWIKN